MEVCFRRGKPVLATFLRFKIISRTKYRVAKSRVRHDNKRETEKRLAKEKSKENKKSHTLISVHFCARFIFVSFLTRKIKIGVTRRSNALQNRFSGRN